MRKHFKNWSILATVIGSTAMVGSMNAQSDIGHLIDVGTNIYTRAQPALGLVQEVGQSKLAVKVANGTATEQDLMELDPNSVSGRVAIANNQYNKLKGKKRKKADLIGNEAEITAEDNGSNTQPVGDLDDWKQSKTFRYSKIGMQAVLSPVFGTEWVLKKASGARARLHKRINNWEEELNKEEKPSKLARFGVGLSKVGAYTLDALALPFTVLEVVTTKLANAIYGYHELLLNPHITAVEKFLVTFRLTAAIIAAKVSISLAWGLGAGIVI